MAWKDIYNRVGRAAKQAAQETAQFGKTIFTVPTEKVVNAFSDASNIGRAAIRATGPETYKQAFQNTPKAPRYTAGTQNLNKMADTGLIPKKSVKPIDTAAGVASSFLTPGLGKVNAFSKLKPVAKLAAYSGVRYGEGYLQGAASNLAQTGDLAEANKAGKTAGLYGATLNTVLSPKLAAEAGSKIATNIADGFNGANIRRAANSFRAHIPERPVGIGEVPVMVNGRPYTEPIPTREVPVPEDYARRVLTRGERVDKPIVYENGAKDNLPVTLMVDEAGNVRSWDTTNPEFAQRYTDSMAVARPGYVGKKPQKFVDQDVRTGKAPAPEKPPLLLPASIDESRIRAEGRNPSPKEAKRIFKKTGYAPEYVNTLKPNEKPLIFSADQGELKRIPVKGREQDSGVKVRSLVGNGMPAGIVEEPKMRTKIKRIFTSGEAELKGQGVSGVDLAETIKDQRTNEDMLRGKLQAHLETVLDGLTPEERYQVTDALEGKIKPEGRVAEAASKLRTTLNAIATKAQEVGLEIKLPDGTSVPFKARENYFPHNYDISQVAKKENEARYIQHLINTGQAKTEMEARQLLSNFLTRATDRRAGNLENARIADLPDYEKDPAKALGKYFGSVSKRLTEVSYYGKKDRLAQNMIEKVRQEGGDAKYAQEVFDLMVGNKRYENKGVDTALKFNIFTKLDLGFITNITQSVNTAARTGVMNTLSAALDAYIVRPKEAGRFAMEAGALDKKVNSATREGIEQLGTVLDMVMAPFQAVENKNRTIAAGAGARYTEALAKQLMKNPESRSAIRQLKGLGLNVEKIIAQGGPTAEDILAGAKSVSDQTQFKVDAIDIPPGWKTNIGRFIGQFKSFSFKQGIFLRDQILSEAKAGNLLPLTRLIALGVPASFAATTARSALTGRDMKQDEKSLDVRKLDYYAKAIGSMPVDLATQGKFLYDTYKNPYATPLKKVGRTAGSVFGPSVGEAFSMVNALEQIGTTMEKNKDLAKGKKASDPYLELKRITAGYVPLVGEAIKNTTFAYPKDNKSDFSRLLTALKEGNDQGVYDALSTYKPESWGSTMKNALQIIEEEDGSTGAGKNVNPQTLLDATDYARNNQAKAASGGGTVDRQKAAVALAKAKLDVAMGKEDKVRVGDSIVVSDPEKESGYRVVNLKTEKEKAKDKVAQTALKTAKEDKDYQKWESLQKDYYNSLAAKQKTLDPEIDAADIAAIQEKKAAILRDVKKYRSYGGAFTKPKKGRKPRTIKATAKVSKVKLVK